MEEEKIEEELGKIGQSLDKDAHLKTALQEEGGWVTILSMGNRPLSLTRYADDCAPRGCA
jgi:hypothetical protein